MLKKEKNILVTGATGYLMGALLPDLKKIPGINVFTLPNERIINNKQKLNDYLLSLPDLDFIIHFGGPSDNNDFQDEYNVACTMVDGTINLVNFAEVKMCKFIYASSMAINEINWDSNDYTVYKLAMERYIQATLHPSRYLILRIPRVYSSDRNKGLMKKLKDNTFIGSQDKVIENVLFKNDFLEQTTQIIKTFLYSYTPIFIYEYTNKKPYTVREIKKILKI